MPATVPVTPSLALRKIASLRILGGHRLCLRFKDGLVAELDFLPWLKSQKGPAITALRRTAFFTQVYLDHGVLTWPNGYDLDPDTVRALADS